MRREDGLGSNRQKQNENAETFLTHLKELRKMSQTSQILNLSDRSTSNTDRQNHPHPTSLLRTSFFLYFLQRNDVLMRGGRRTDEREPRGKTDLYTRVGSTVRDATTNLEELFILLCDICMF